jgi:hypothetical protein
MDVVISSWPRTRHGGSGAAALRLLPAGLALVGGVHVHLLVAALLAAEGRACRPCT